MESGRVALVSMHTSPLAMPGSGDAGGLNVHVGSLAAHLVEAGWEVEILTRRTDPRQPSVYRSGPGVGVRFLDAGALAVVPKEDLDALTDEFGARIAQLPLFDLYHSHYWLSAAAALPVAEAQRVPHVLSLHTVAAMKNRHPAPGQAAEPLARVERERFLARRSAAVVSATGAERSAVIDDYGADPRRVHVIEPGVDTALFRPRPAGEEARRGVRPVILAVGRIQPLKRQDLAIRALSRIDPDVRPLLVLIGESSGPVEAYAGELRRLVADRGLARDVVFAGAENRSRLARQLASAALVVIPSASETYGLVALEAAASGVPVIATAIDGLRESVVDGVTGRLVPWIDDPFEEERAWGRAIMELLADGSLRSRLSRSAEVHARARSWEATARATAAVYRRVIAEDASCCADRPEREPCGSR